jgi:hypothetical protein
MIVLPFASSGIGVGQSFLSNVVGQRVMDDLRLALYTHLQWMPLRFFTETRTGEIQSRIGNDVNGVQSVVTDTAASLLSNFATVATTVIAMLILDWRLTILSLGMLPVFAYITYRVGRVRREVSGQTQRSLAEVSAITEESLSVSGILLSKTFGQQRASIERFARESRRLGDLQIRQQMVGRWFFAMIGTFFSIAPAFVYLLAGTLIINGDTGVSVASGIGALWGRRELLDAMPPFMTGGSMIIRVTLEGAEWNQVPHKFEAGTPAIAEAVGLGAAIDYLTALGMDNVREHERYLFSAAWRALGEIPGVRRFGPDDPDIHAGVISFVLDEAHPHDVATIFDHEGVAVRAGHHCAQPVMLRYDIPATTRASFYVYNDLDDVQALAGAVKATQAVFGGQA